MSLLRAALRWHAVVWTLLGVVLLLAPGWFVETIMGQPPLGQDSWLRMGGIMAIALAAQMVLVGHRIEELWWWAWTFVFLGLGVGVVSALTALTGVPDGAAVWPWWAIAAVSGALAVVEIAALARSGTERSPI